MVERTDLTQREVAELFGVSSKTIDRWRKRQRFPGAYKLGGWRYPIESIEHAKRPVHHKTARPKRNANRLVDLDALSLKNVMKGVS